ncbi:hypothetical protein TL16_g09596 [Triparma laevis f. inornata]|uniref:DDHD domain-containing protein n=1 Tax=Triparma laevis f. inornata TaxID=1714386 RepID=A0A9W7B8J9_9STRA|nr:hypothetical protein TL16_g09596 [Triparma laevis f. inornata]
MDDSAILDEMSRTLHSIADRPGNGGSGTGSPSLPNSPPSNLSSRPLKSPLNAVPIVLASSSTANNRRTRYKKNENSTAIEYISSLSTRVGETTKRKVSEMCAFDGAPRGFVQFIWDSNDMYVDGAARARDKYERIYHAAKTSCKSAYSATLVMYSTAKSGAETIENGLLVPVRDYLILPSFWIVEKSITGTTAFVFSDRMANACNFSLSLIEDYIPFNVGKRIVAPTIRTSFNVAHTSVLILQYPIPSQQTVTSITTKTVNSTKWALGVVGREVFFYVDMVDVSVTRALAKARWSVLGFGQYAGLSQEQREEVASQMCERYLDMPDPIARYEFASHVRIQNKRLYDDLIRSGLLRRRGGSLCENDTWLDVLPEWRLTSKNIETDDLFSDPEFISMKRISSSANNSETTASIVTTKVVPLWFYMPLVNGSRPSRDTPWVRFGEDDRAKIEAQYMGRGRGGGGGGKRHSSAPKIGPVPAPAPGEGDEEDDAVDDPFTQISDDPAPSSLSQWHEPDTSSDVFVDEGRHVVTWKNKKPKNTNTKNSICLMKPVFWRYYGDGEPVRRCVWMLDSGKAGLQPFNDQSAGVLEDAYQFLKWQQAKRRSDETTLGELMDPGGSSAAVLLTVQVQAPDGEEQLIQFRSLHQIFAIKKTLGGALSIWKKRVYRGAEVVIEVRDGVGEIADAETSGSSGEQFVNGMNMFVEEFSEKPESTEEHSAAERRNNEHVVERSVAAPSPFSSAHRAKPTSEQVEDNVEHLILVVHGIGKALQAFDLLGLVQLKSIVDCCKWMRDNHEEVVNEQQQQRANQKRNSAPSSPFPTTTSSSRVEFIPIEWHERFNRVSRQNDCQIPTAGLNDISLNTIPHMRSFANDAMLDTLYFMSEVSRGRS